MPSHYIRLLNNIMTYAEKINPKAKDWFQDVFNDVTENGKTLYLVKIPSKNGLYTYALSGNVYYCEFSSDKFREDTLVVYRIYSADLHHPSREPQIISGKFLPITQNENPDKYLDEASYIFRDEIVEINKRAPQANLKKMDMGLPSGKLKEVLKEANDKQRLLWFPNANNREQLNSKEVLNRIQIAWKLYNLVKYLNVTPRQKGIFDKTIGIEPTKENIDEFLELFDIAFLNKFAADKINKIEYIFEMLESISEIPLPEKYKCVIWNLMTERLDPRKLRIELKEVILEIIKLEEPDRNVWTNSLIDVIKSVGNRYNDEILIREAEKSEVETNPSLSIKIWLDKVHLRDELKSATDQKYAGEFLLENCNVISDKSVKLGKHKNIDDVNVEAIIIQPEQTCAKKEIGEYEELIEDWVLRLRMPMYKDFFDSFKNEIDDHFTTINKRFVKINRIENIKGLLESLENLRQDIKNRINKIPDISLLSRDFGEAFDLFLKYKDLFGDEVNFLINIALSPSDYKEIAEIYLQKDLFSKIPRWSWTDIDEYDGEENSNKNKGDVYYLKKIVNPVIRTRISKAISLINIENPLFTLLFESIISPPEGEDIDNYFSKMVEKIRNVCSKFTDIKTISINQVRDLINSGVSEENIIDIDNRLKHAKEKMQESGYNQLIVKIGDLQDFDKIDEIIFFFEEAISFFEIQFGSTVSVPVQLFTEWIERNKNTIKNKTNKIKQDNLEFSIAHNWVNHPRQKLRLSYSKYPKNPSGEYGYVTAPVGLISNFRPRDLSIKLTYEIQSQLTAGWPSEWEKPRPYELNILSSQWREHKEGFIFTFKVEIPIRPPKYKENHIKLSLSLKGQDEKTLKQIPIKNEIIWDYIQDKNEKIELVWPDSIQTDYVTKHPIGPQENLDYIENRLNNGSSFCIVSPRRFGKTTLSMFLSEKQNVYNYIIPPPILCTRMIGNDNRLNYKKIWQTFYEYFLNTLEAPIKISDNNIPEPDGFDFIRKAAKKQNKRGILLILDEAQLFFSKSDGPNLGNMLKDLLETEWSRSDKKIMVPLVLGFIGLPSMLEKMGVNLQGFLMPRDTRTIKETKLNELINQFTKNRLFTTQEAREALCNKSQNVFMLKTIINKLITYVSDDCRNWIYYDDVIEVIDDLKKGLIENREPEVAGYLRDVLNDSEDVNIWQPKICYPMAVAIAKAESEFNDEPSKTIERANGTLNTWCLQTGTYANKTLIYTNEKVLEHYNKLEELGIYSRQKRFQSDILKAWLLGLSKNFPNDDKDRESLFSGALERIKLPDDRELIYESPQANVYRFAEDKDLYAMRIIKLVSQEDRIRFHETVEILKLLKNKDILREDGSQYLYSLRDLGIGENSPDIENNAMLGIEIYKWIDGATLEEKIAKLPTLLVASIGIKLAKALKLIHSYDIIHRDLNPRNIILENNTMSPVVIDFGLARYSTRVSKTVIESEYTAPECISRDPKWSKASDVFSFGKTLLSLLSKKSNNNDKLIDLLKRCVNSTPENRPDTKEIVNSLESITLELNILTLQNDAQQALETITGDELKIKWYAQVIEKIQNNFTAVFMGVHDDIYDKCAEVAQFLDFALENYPTNEPTKLKLSSVYNKKTESIGDNLLNKECIRFMSNLRNGRNHIDPKKSRQNILKKFSNPSDEKMKEMTIESARLVGSSLNVKSIGNIAELFLK